MQKEVKKQNNGRNHGPNTDWARVIVGVIKTVSGRQEQFTSADIWKWKNLGNCTDNRAMGAAFLIAHRLRYCEPTNQLMTVKNRTSHNRPLRVWRSLIR